MQQINNPHDDSFALSAQSAGRRSLSPEKTGGMIELKRFNLEVVNLHENEKAKVKF